MKYKSMIVGVAALSVWGAVAGEKDLDWSKAQFLSVAAPRDKAKGEPNVSTFRSVFKNPKTVKSAVWHTTGLGVYEAYVNGTEVGGFLKPGYTHPKRCRLATASDVTASFKREAGAENVLAASVSASWWCDRMYGRMAGIRPDPKAPGFKHFFLTPQTDPRVKSVKASYICPYGTIESEWKINDQGEDSYRFVIPEGTTATVVVPNGRNFELGPGTYLMPDEE